MTTVKARKRHRLAVDPTDELDPRNWVEHFTAKGAEAYERKEKRKALPADHLDRFGRQGDFRAVRELSARALNGSGEHRAGSMAVVEWDVSGKCELPRHVTYHKAGIVGWIDMTVPCRTECGWCLRKRARLWRSRAIAEMQASSRTWFGTITLNADAQYRALCLADKKAQAAGVNFASLLPGEQLQRRHEQITPELTKWLKRVRKLCGGPLRYLLVMEAHKSGLPHYHVLVHEVSPGSPVLYRHLARTWPHGFVEMKLVDRDDPKAAYYVCKYLSKSALGRVRPSCRYGQGTPARDSEQREKLDPRKTTR